MKQSLGSGRQLFCFARVFLSAWGNICSQAKRQGPAKTSRFCCRKVPTAAGVPAGPVPVSHSAVRPMGCSCKQNQVLAVVPKFAKQNGELILLLCSRTSDKIFQ